MIELASKPKSHRTTVLEAALDYHRREWAVIDLDYCSKAIREPDWPRLVLDEEDLHKRLTSANRNIAIILGDRSDGLIDIDLDSPEVLKLVEQFLPPTEAIFGRKSKPKSHYLYRVQEPPKAAKFTDINGTTLVEIRSSGCTTVFLSGISACGQVMMAFENCCAVCEKTDKFSNRRLVNILFTTVTLITVITTITAVTLWRSCAI